jgi:hypothetical protein
LSQQPQQKQQEPTLPFPIKCSALLSEPTSLSLATTSIGFGAEKHEVDDMPDFLLGFERSVASRMKAAKGQPAAAKMTRKQSIIIKGDTAIPLGDNGNVPSDPTAMADIPTVPSDLDDHALWQSTTTSSIATPPIRSSRSFDDFHRIWGNNSDLFQLHDESTAPPASNQSSSSSKGPETTTRILSAMETTSNTNLPTAMDTASLFSAEVYSIFAK